MAYTKDGRRFSEMHKRMFNKLGDYIDLEKYFDREYSTGIKNKYQRYYADVYKWVKVLLISSENIPNHYFLKSEIEPSGLREIDSQGIITTKGKITRNSIPYIEPYSQHRLDLSKKEFIPVCEKNLRDVFEKYILTSKDPEETASDIAHAGFTALSDKEQSDISDFCQRNNLVGFSEWAIAVLYAQDGRLPKEIVSHPRANIYMASKEEIEKTILYVSVAWAQKDW